jgi:hypothetical protein
MEILKKPYGQALSLLLSFLLGLNPSSLKASPSLIEEDFSLLLPKPEAQEACLLIQTSSEFSAPQKEAEEKKLIWSQRLTEKYPYWKVWVGGGLVTILGGIGTVYLLWGRGGRFPSPPSQPPLPEDPLPVPVPKNPQPSTALIPVPMSLAVANGVGTEFFEESVGIRGSSRNQDPFLCYLFNKYNRPPQNMSFQNMSPAGMLTPTSGALIPYQQPGTLSPLLEKKEEGEKGKEEKGVVQAQTSSSTTPKPGVSLDPSNGLVGRGSSSRGRGRPSPGGFPHRAQTRPPAPNSVSITREEKVTFKVERKVTSDFRKKVANLLSPLEKDEKSISLNISGRFFSFQLLSPTLINNMEELNLSGRLPIEEIGDFFRRRDLEKLKKLTLGRCPEDTRPVGTCYLTPEEFKFLFSEGVLPSLKDLSLENLNKNFTYDNLPVTLKSLKLKGYSIFLINQ